MKEQNHRTSKVQIQILKCLVSGLTRGHVAAKSTVLNDAVCSKLKTEIHPNNFRTSCEKLEARGLVLRKKKNFDWFINITPDGIDFLESLESEK